MVGASGEDSNATGVNGRPGRQQRRRQPAPPTSFTRSGTTWSQQAYLKASNTGAGDDFGSSVAVSGDTVVVGALGEDSNATGVNGNQADNSATSAGAAYTFAPANSNPARITISDSAAATPYPCDDHGLGARPEAG